jgi:cytochrome bd-type quinol oxidase subunit 2|tara:strand:- start:402 stop:788 length:387 start_codon:yes stop_codon:yes gene_type:complete
MKKAIEKFIFYFSIAWFFYSVIILSIGSCGLFMEENKEGEWTISYTLQDAETGVEYDNYYDGPMSKDEANIIINNCISESNTKRKKYGTVYNLRTENSSLNSLIILIIFILPYLFFYLFYKIRNQSDN